jgi:hypothetical protein
MFGDNEMSAANASPDGLWRWNGSEWVASLAGEVSQRIQLGYRVESTLPGQVVMVRGRRPNHILHLLLSVVTLGWWLIVWLIVAASAKESRTVLTVNPDGSVHDSSRLSPRPAGGEAVPWYKQTWAITGMVLVGISILIAISGAVGG